MIALLDRRFLAQGLIVAALILGGWMMFVQPRVVELRAIEAQIAEASVGLQKTDEIAVQLIAQQAARIRTRISEIVAASTAAEDTAGLYRQVMTLATQHDVIVESLNPGTAAAAGVDKSVQVASINMAVHGGYEQIASFLDALDSLRGFVRPGSLTITPREDGEQRIVQAQVVCEAMRFALPEKLAGAPQSHLNAIGDPSSAPGGTNADR